MHTRPQKASSSNSAPKLEPATAKALAADRKAVAAKKAARHAKRQFKAARKLLRAAKENYRAAKKEAKAAAKNAKHAQKILRSRIKKVKNQRAAQPGASAPERMTGSAKTAARKTTAVPSRPKAKARISPSIGPARADPTSDDAAAVDGV